MDNEFLTIPEVARLTGKTVNTIYRYIRNDKLRYNRVIYQGREVYRIEKKEIQRFFKCDISDISEDIIGNISSDISKDTSDISEDKIQRAIEKAISQQQAVFLKPIEEQALYRLGKIEQENNFLKAKVETLLQELEQYKSLPGPADMEKWKKEKEDLLSEGEIHRQEQEEKHRRELEAVKGKYEDYLQKEKEDLLSRAETIQKEQDSRYKVELEKQKKDIEEAHRQELEKIKKQAEEEKKQIAETWRKELEEARRPWWKFW